MTRVITIILAGYLVLYASVSAAEASGKLGVSATVPPKACRFPDTCKPVPHNAKTRVKVNKQGVHYIGSPPNVSEKDGRLTITF